MYLRNGNLGAVVVLHVEREQRSGSDHVMVKTVRDQTAKKRNVTMTLVHPLGVFGCLGAHVVLHVGQEYRRGLEYVMVITAQDW